MRNFVYSVIVLATLALMTACEADPVRPTDDSSGNTQSILPLTTRDAVLNNLEVAWDHRATDRIDDLLDDDFTFYFHGDGGGSIPVQWSRADELQVTHDLFVSNRHTIPTGPVCTSIRVDLAADNPQWAGIVPDAFPAETWYTAVVPYSASFKMESDATLIISGGVAEFTVRNVGSEVAPYWQLVEWRDGQSQVAGSFLTATSEATWGGIKSLYYDSLAP